MSLHRAKPTLFESGRDYSLPTSISISLGSLAHDNLLQLHLYSRGTYDGVCSVGAMMHMLPVCMRAINYCLICSCLKNTRVQRPNPGSEDSNKGSKKQR